MRWLLIFLCLCAFQASAADRWASPTGSGTTCSVGSPCLLQEAISGSSCGDTVRLTDGSHYDQITVANPCAGESALTILCDSGDGNCMVSGLKEWTDSAGNDGEDYAAAGSEALWTLVNASKVIYRTANHSFPNTPFGGWFENKGVVYRLNPASVAASILTPDSDSDGDGNGVPDDEEGCRTCAPWYDSHGVWREGGSTASTRTVAVRLKRSWVQEHVWSATDPGDLQPGLAGDGGARIWLVPENTTGVTFTSSASNVVWDGIDVWYFGHNIDIRAGADEILIRDMDFSRNSRRYPAYINMGGDITFDNTVCDGKLTSWLQRESVKQGDPRPLETHQSDCWHVRGGSGGVLTVQNSTCANMFDCMVYNAGAPDKIIFAGNTIVNNRDDVLQGVAHRVLHIFGNTMTTGGLISWWGPNSGTSSTQCDGNVDNCTFVYHNIVDGREPQQCWTPESGGSLNDPNWTRVSAGWPDGLCIGRVFQHHGGTAPLTAKIYNNTFMQVRDHWNQATGAGPSYMHGNGSTALLQTQYLNNIFWVESGPGPNQIVRAAPNDCTQFYDGNIYWRPGVNEAGGCSGVSCMFNSHSGTSSNWDAWCGSADGPCGQASSGARNDNCALNGGGTGDWDANSRNVNPEIDASSYIPIQGGNAASGGVDIPDTWPAGDQHDANGHIGALAPSGGTFDITGLTISEASCVIGSTCVSGQFDATVDADGSESGSADCDVDCLGDGTPDITAASMSCTNGHCDYDPTGICDYSGESSPRTIQVEFSCRRGASESSQTTPFEIEAAPQAGPPPGTFSGTTGSGVGAQ